MKILWLTENYPPNRGGMAQSCDRIVYNLRQQGLEIHVLHLTQRVKQIKYKQVQGGQDIFYPTHVDLAHTLNCMWHFLTSQHEQAPYTHLVVFGGHFPMFAGPTFARLLGIPLITLLRGNDFDAGLFTPRKRKILEDCLRNSSLVCAVSKDKLEKMAALFPEVRTAYIPNGIDTSDWQPLASDLSFSKLWRTEHLQGGQKVIGLFGHLKEKKGVTFFLQQLCKLQLQTAFHLLIVGDLSQEVADFFEENAQLPTTEQLQYTLYPFMDRFELLAYYPICDIVAIPSFYDGLPNVLLEVGALGIPLIASRVAGMADVLEPSTHGFLFHPTDEASCREAIYQLYQTSSVQLQEMGQACQALICEQLNHHQEAARYKEVFEQL
ncbi:MAG: glycosyltransferase family 4 protein [Thermonemataceae bacterium]